MKTSSVSALVVGLLFGALLSFASCGGTKSATGCTNCTGCCSNNVCEPGNTTSLCGAAGDACSVCSASQLCSSGVCKSGSGNGGGTAGTGGGTASNGGGTASNGGGTHAGGGTASSGGGTASSGGGTASNGGGTASNGGGTASNGGGTATTCTAQATYGAVGAIDPSNAFGTFDGLGDDSYEGVLNMDTLPDYVDVELYGGYGAFGTGPIATGTFALTQDDFSYSSCGICVLILTDNAQGQPPTDLYMATGGSVTLTSVTGRITGSLSNVTFQHVNIDMMGNTTMADSCPSAITSVSYDAPLVYQDGGM